MTSEFEGHIHGHDGNELFYHHWKAQDEKGLILLTHGLAEHSESYREFALRLNKSNWSVIAWDLRGHGRSEGKRGYAEDFEFYVKDLDYVYKYIKKNELEEGQDLVFFSHSMGALITSMYFLTHGPVDCKCLVLTSPCFGLALDIPPIKRKAAEFGANWFPKLTLWNEITYDKLSRDSEQIKLYEGDPLRHDKISPKVFVGMLQSFQYLSDHAEEIGAPTLMQVAGSDKVTSPQAAVKIFEKLSSPKKELKVYEDSYHEIYNDLDKDEAYRDLLGYINKN